MVKITFECGHTEELEPCVVRDMVNFTYCSSCYDLYEINDKKQLKLGLDI